MQFLDLTILSFIFEIMLYNATNIKTIFDKKKTLEGLLIKKSKIIVSNYRASASAIGTDIGSKMAYLF